MADPLSRRGIVGFVAALATAPRAVEAQAMEALNQALSRTPDDYAGQASPPATATGSPESLTPEQLIMKRLVRDANKERRRRINALYACRSMSKAARRAYIRDAREQSDSLELKFAKLMGWRAENDDFDEWG